LVGADLSLSAGGELLLPLEPEFEHALLVMAGAVDVDGDVLAPGSMIYLGTARHELRVTAPQHARALLLGGAPFDERIVMWWNFVARSNEEIVAAREEWTSGSAFGDVAGYGGYRLPAPALPAGRLKPGGAVR
jgi:redox-sensitive bicupin YhaK (pirin superfamily)